MAKTNQGLRVKWGESIKAVAQYKPSANEPMDLLTAITLAIVINADKTLDALVKRVVSMHTADPGVIREHILQEINHCK